jgi:acyl-CoA synthetase (AMP-forming)/AMP-acid ligase II
LKIQVRRVLCLPQFATAAIYSNHFCPLRHGEVCFVMRRYDTTAFLQNIVKFNITEVSVLPPMLVQVLRSPLATKETLKSLRYVHGGGAAMPQTLVNRLKNLLPKDTPCTSIWGLSEGSGIGTCLFWPEHDDTGSIGRLLTGLSAK